MPGAPPATLSQLIALRQRRARRSLALAAALVSGALGGLLYAVLSLFRVGYTDPVQKLSFILAFFLLVGCLFYAIVRVLLGAVSPRLRAWLGDRTVPPAVRDLCPGCGALAGPSCPACAEIPMPCRWALREPTSLPDFFAYLSIFLGIGFACTWFLDSERVGADIVCTALLSLCFGVVVFAVRDRFGPGAAGKPDCVAAEIPGGFLVSTDVDAAVWLEGERIAWAEGSVSMGLPWPEPSGEQPSPGQRALCELLAAAEMRDLVHLERRFFRRWQRQAGASAAPGGYREGASPVGHASHDAADVSLALGGQTFVAPLEGAALPPVAPIVDEVLFALCKLRLGSRCLGAVRDDKNLAASVREAAAEARKGLDPGQLDLGARRIAQSISSLRAASRGPGAPGLGPGQGFSPLRASSLQPHSLPILQPLRSSSSPRPRSGLGMSPCRCRLPRLLHPWALPPLQACS